MNHVAAFLVSLPLLAGACTVPTLPTASEAETTGAASEALATRDYAYFFVDRAAGGAGYVARPVNNTRVSCGREALERCTVEAVDLAPMGITSGDAESLLSDLGGARAPNAIVLVGTIDEGRHGRRTLRAVEAWRAPEPTRWGGTVYAVTRDGVTCDVPGCRAANVVRINAWRKSVAPDVVLDGAPSMAHCRFVPLLATGCTEAYEAAEAALATRAGLLVAGHRDDRGVLVAEQYFVRVGVGALCADGGWNYCGTTQGCNPDSGQCSALCTGTCEHGRGRGVMPYERPLELATWFTTVILRAPVDTGIHASY